MRNDVEGRLESILSYSTLHEEKYSSESAASGMGGTYDSNYDVTIITIITMMIVVIFI
jgi:hypothetical protein